MNIIEVRPHRGGCQCFEGDGVGPYWNERNAKEYAIGYAKSRMASRTGEVRVLREDGSVEETFAFTNSRKI